MINAQLLSIFDRVEREQSWFEQNLDLIKKEYDNKFIAIKDNQVIAVGTLMEDIIKTLKAKNIDPSETFIKFVSKIAVII